MGKRPRGIHASPDGKYLFVAVSGSPISGPPKLDAKGNPIPEKEDDDNADHAADGIAVVDPGKRDLVQKLPAGSDPEEFAVLEDGQHLVISNEDVGTASFLNVATRKVETIVPVTREPEGVTLSPSGEEVYVTCEACGEIFIIGTRKREVIGKFVVGRQASFSRVSAGWIAGVCAFGEFGTVAFGRYRDLPRSRFVAVAVWIPTHEVVGRRRWEKALCEHWTRGAYRCGRYGEVRVGEQYQGRSASMGNGNVARWKTSICG